MYAALDISKNKIGIAISNWNRDGILWASSIKNKLPLLEKYYKYYKPEMTLIGIPTHSDGNLTSNGNFIKSFIKNIDFICPFEYVDEYLSTQEAKRIKNTMKLKIEVDALVAMIMIYKHLKIESALLHYGLYY